MTSLDELKNLLRKDENEKAYELIKEYRGVNAEILMNEGIHFGIIRDYDLSISYFELAEKISENNKIKEEVQKNLAWTYYNRGNAYCELKQYEKGVEDYNKAIEINPNCVEAYNNRGNAYCELKQYEKAIKDYTRTIALNPEDAVVYYNRGNAYHELNQHEKAIDDYTKTIELNPKYAKAYINRGNAYCELKLHEKAIEDYNKAIELNPKDAGAYNNRGKTYCELEEYEKAIKDCDRAIEHNPNLAEAYYNRGNAYRNLERHEKAITDYNKAIELNPNLVGAYNNRGNAYRELNQCEEAIEDYNKAIERNPNLAVAYLNHGATLVQTNEGLDKAIEDFKHARDLFEGKDKERMLGFIEWAKARKEMNMKNWGDFRECMNEAREIFEKINDPLSRSFAASIKFSHLDGELDNALNIPDPIKALEELETALKNPPEVKGLIDPERTIFGARISSFAILSEFISSLRGIDENTDLRMVKTKLAELLEDSREVEDAFESVDFVKGKTAIVDIQEIISSVKQEIGKIEWAANKKQKALGILTEYWSRLGPAIKVMNGISTRETEDIALRREIREMKTDLRGELAETKGIISKGFEKSSEEHKEILQKIHETENILMQKDVVNARYRIEFPPPPSPAKIIVDIPIGKLTEEQIEEKAEEIAYKFKYLRGKVKEEFLEAIKLIPETGKKILKRLRKIKG